MSSDIDFLQRKLQLVLREIARKRTYMVSARTYLSALDPTDERTVNIVGVIKKYEEAVDDLQLEAVQLHDNMAMLTATIPSVSTSSHEIYTSSSAEHQFTPQSVVRAVRFVPQSSHSMQSTALESEECSFENPFSTITQEVYANSSEKHCSTVEPEEPVISQTLDEIAASREKDVQERITRQLDDEVAPRTEALSKSQKRQARRVRTLMRHAQHQDHVSVTLSVLVSGSMSIKKTDEEKTGEATASTSDDMTHPISTLSHKISTSMSEEHRFTPLSVVNAVRFVPHSTHRSQKATFDAGEESIETQVYETAKGVYTKSCEEHCSIVGLAKPVTSQTLDKTAASRENEVRERITRQLNDEEAPITKALSKSQKRQARRVRTLMRHAQHQDHVSVTLSVLDSDSSSIKKIDEEKTGEATASTSDHMTHSVSTLSHKISTSMSEEHRFTPLSVVNAVRFVPHSTHHSQKTTFDAGEGSIETQVYETAKGVYTKSSEEHCSIVGPASELKDLVKKATFDAGEESIETQVYETAKRVYTKSSEEHCSIVGLAKPVTSQTLDKTAASRENEVRERITRQLNDEEAPRTKALSKSQKRQARRVRTLMRHAQHQDHVSVTLSVLDSDSSSIKKIDEEKTGEATASTSDHMTHSVSTLSHKISTSMSEEHRFTPLSVVNAVRFVPHSTHHLQKATFDAGEGSIKTPVSETANGVHTNASGEHCSIVEPSETVTSQSLDNTATFHEIRVEDRTTTEIGEEAPRTTILSKSKKRHARRLRTLMRVAQYQDHEQVTSQTSTLSIHPASQKSEVGLEQVRASHTIDVAEVSYENPASTIEYVVNTESSEGHRFSIELADTVTSQSFDNIGTSYENRVEDHTITELGNEVSQRTKALSKSQKRQARRVRTLLRHVQHTDHEQVTSRTLTLQNVPASQNSEVDLEQVRTSQAEDTAEETIENPASTIESVLNTESSEDHRFSIESAVSATRFEPEHFHPVRSMHLEVGDNCEFMVQRENASYRVRGTITYISDMYVIIQPFDHVDSQKEYYLKRCFGFTKS